MKTLTQTKLAAVLISDKVDFKARNIEICLQQRQGRYFNMVKEVISPGRHKTFKFVFNKKKPQKTTYLQNA